MMKYLVTLMVVALVVILATFGIQNPYPISIRFMQFQSAAVPLYLVILLSALLGAAASLLLALPGGIHRRLEVRRLHQQVTGQAEQVSQLQARLPEPVMAPLSDESRR